MPLADLELGRADVNAFWDLQHWDLAQPRDAHLSNCVFCFLKGSENLKKVRARMREAPTATAPGFGPLKDTPSDLGWWRRMEAKYGRDLTAEGRRADGRVTRIGFFGARKFSYDAVEDGRATAGIQNCDCTQLNDPLTRRVTRRTPRTPTMGIDRRHSTERRNPEPGDRPQPAPEATDPPPHETPRRSTELPLPERRQELGPLTRERTAPSRGGMIQCTASFNATRRQNARTVGDPSASTSRSGSLPQPGSG